MIWSLTISSLCLSFVACAICGNLSRIADAIEAQNRAYGIADATATQKTQEAA